jgi:DNA cross-link repair 1C protein
MSTFDGKVKEFPDIRIDHFRLSGAAAASSKPPLAYFLSHVHSDHLQGLETCKSPFIYCSPATKAILLRLEKYSHRINFAKGILETRKQTYRHLKLLLKTIPLATPTVIDLAPGKSIRVTLFDANHCVGAVMFLIEGDGKAILYTGDIRSELWWVNNIVREPVMLAYALQNGGKGSLKQLDCIYLDTTFASKDNPYKHFPSKLEGTQELLEKISKYPKDTVFYFDTWTSGYEDVWITLCNFLDCQVHVDEYRYKLYRALATGEGIKAEEAARLFGYKCGNHTQEGCLTERQSRLHSCEQGTGCEVFKKGMRNARQSAQTAR